MRQNFVQATKHISVRKLNSMMQRYFENLIVAQLVYKLPLFCGTEASFSCSPETATGPYLEGTSREPIEVGIKRRQ
jgi:hypothetical protein